MLNRSRTRHVLKWIGTAACVLVAAAFVCTGYTHWFWSARFPGGVGVRISWGAVSVAGGSGRTMEISLPSLTAAEAQKMIEDLFGLRWRPSVWWNWPNFYICVPLWIPFGVFAVPTGYLWYGDRRRIPAGHCRECGYDLTGNVTGRCPECGKIV